MVEQHGENTGNSMLELKSNIEIDAGSNRGFGVVFAIIFLLIGLYPLLINEGDIRYWSISIAVVLLVAVLFYPAVLSKLSLLWFKFGIMLGSIIAPIIMFVVYFFTVVPIGLLMKIIGKDLLNQKINKTTKSYWINRSQPVGSMKDQF